ncbi:MAG TPA: hypothetical protein VG899_11045 [Mycobacteriales bacterium]|nr:hypothetical protein [Mycobacteriales bacterium]
MTDLNERFARMIEDEPAAPQNLDGIVAGGRRALRRRTTVTAVAGALGTAAIATAVAVPVAASAHSTPGASVALAASASPSPTHIGKECVKWHKAKHRKGGEYLVVKRTKHGAETIYTCRVVKPKS